MAILQVRDDVTIREGLKHFSCQKWFVGQGWYKMRCDMELWTTPKNRLAAGAALGLRLSAAPRLHSRWFDDVLCVVMVVAKKLNWRLKNL
jgi:hypothetical protein